MAYGGFYGGGGGSLKDIAPVSAPGEGFGMYHNLSTPEVQQEQNELSSGARRGTGTLTQYQPRSHVNAAGEMTTWATPGPGTPQAPGGGEMSGKSLRDLAQLGEPTSYAGGAGAPAPVEVLGGGGRVYVNPEGGAGYKTKVQAGQAWNQAQLGKTIAENAKLGLEPQNVDALNEAAEKKYGTYQPVGYTLESLKQAGELAKVKASGLGPYYDVLAQGALADREKAAALERGNQFRKTYVATFGPIPKEGTPEHQEFLQAHEAATVNGPQAGVNHLMENQLIREYEKKFPAAAVAEGKKSNPVWWREEMLRQIKAQKPQPGGITPAYPAALTGAAEPSLAEQAGMLGNAAYEAAIPQWMRPTKGKNY